MEIKWKNDHQEAWVLEDGTLIVKSKVPIPMDGHDFHYQVDTLPLSESENDHICLA